MSNRPEWIVSFLAVHQVGGVVVALNTWATPRELEYALHHADVTILLAIEGIRSHDYRQTLAEVRPRLPLLRHVVWLEPSRAADQADHQWIDWSSLAQGASQAEAERRGTEENGRAHV